MHRHTCVRTRARRLSLIVEDIHATPAEGRSARQLAVQGRSTSDTDGENLASSGTRYTHLACCRTGVSGSSRCGWLPQGHESGRGTMVWDTDARRTDQTLLAGSNGCHNKL